MGSQMCRHANWSEIETFTYLFRELVGEALARSWIKFGRIAHDRRLDRRGVGELMTMAGLLLRGLGVVLFGAGGLGSAVAVSCGGVIVGSARTCE